MSERKLKNRRRRAPKGRLIRVSNIVYETLDGQRRSKSWDALMRRMLGLPDRAGNPQPLAEGMLELHSGVFLLKLPDATWREVSEVANKMAERIAAKKKVRLEVPVRMREIR